MANASVQAEFSSYHVLLTGKVQGVGFRAFVIKSAYALRVGGWVRNRGQSQVELMFSADGVSAQSFIEQLKKGPAASDVKELVVRIVRTRAFGDFRRLPKKAGATQTAGKAESGYTFDPAFLAICQKLSSVLPQKLKYHNSLTEIPTDWGFHQLRSEARKHGLMAIQLGKSRPRMHLIEGAGGRVGLLSTRPSHSSVLQTTVADDKSLTTLALGQFPQHLPKNWQVTQFEDALIHLKHCDALVTKPSRGSTAKGVTTNITNDTTLAQAFKSAQAADPDGRVQLEEHICAVDLRVLFVGETFVAAYMRFPANVVGDGNRTVAELIKAKNEARSKVPGIGPANRISSGRLTQNLLKDQGLRPSSVPEVGRFIQLGLRPNTSDGADQIDITDLIHSSIPALCETVVRTLGGNGFWGFDILSEDFAKPATDARVIICEANNRPFGGVFRHATHGVHHNFFAPALSSLHKTLKPKRSGPEQRYALLTQGDSVPIKEFTDPQEAREAFWEKAETADWQGRLCLQKDKKPAPTVRKSLQGLEPEICSTENTTALETDMSAELGPDYRPWRANLLIQVTENGHVATDTLAPSQFAETLLRPAHLPALRNVLGSAGCQLMPWSYIADADALALVELPTSGRLILSKRWRNGFTIQLDGPRSAARLAKRLPAQAYPIRLEQWQGPETLEGVIVQSDVVATGLRTDKGLHLLEKSPPGLIPNCKMVSQAIPGLNRARAIFRRPLGYAAQWVLQDVSTDLSYNDLGRSQDGRTNKITQALAKAIAKSATRILFCAPPSA